MSLNARKPPKPGASSYHKGRDYGAGEGTPIYAAAAGTVITVSYNSTRGNYVVIRHDGLGLETWYQHMSSVKVSVGQKVTKGQHIGGVGHSGVSTGDHLHFEVHVNGVPKDPRNYL